MIARSPTCVASSRRLDEHSAVGPVHVVACADLETAADAAGEAFLLAWRWWDEFPAQPRGWLMAVTRRTSVGPTPTLIDEPLVAS
jgi:predicted RNA polymerase sigma factor